jgi:hypothetical protein
MLQQYVEQLYVPAAQSAAAELSAKEERQPVGAARNVGRANS